MSQSQHFQGMAQSPEPADSFGVIEVNDLVIDFPIDAALLNRRYLRAVNHVSFRLMAGQALAIVGESGSGKYLCSGTLSPISAGIWVPET